MLWLRSHLLLQGLDHSRPRIDDTVFAMPHAHHLATGGQAMSDEIPCALRLADFQRHFQGELIGRDCGYEGAG